MTKLLWDQVGQRFYETGVDRGVLYLSDGSGIPWNGLTSVQENFAGGESTSYFLDGIKYLDSDVSSDFSATIKAITYPDEFLEYEGNAAVSDGLYADYQNQKLFSLSYRTKIGNDLDGSDLGYKIHVMFNLLAIQDAQSYETVDNSASALEFTWRAIGTPGKVSGWQPTAHVIIDSRKISPYRLQQIENTLYGTSTTDPSLPSLTDFVMDVLNWHIITITDNGDGTWTASTPFDEYITMLDSTTFEITEVDATYLDSNTYTITSTDTPQGG